MKQPVLANKQMFLHPKMHRVKKSLFLGYGDRHRVNPMFHGVTHMTELISHLHR